MKAEIEYLTDEIKEVDRKLYHYSPDRLKEGATRVNGAKCKVISDDLENEKHLLENILNFITTNSLTTDTMNKNEYLAKTKSLRATIRESNALITDKKLDPVKDKLEIAKIKKLISESNTEISEIELDYIEDNKPCNSLDKVEITLSSGRKAVGIALTFGILSGATVCITSYKAGSNTKFITTPHKGVSIL